MRTGTLASGLAAAVRGAWLGLLGAGALAAGVPALAQPVQSIDPNSAIDAETQRRILQTANPPTHGADDDL